MNKVGLLVILGFFTFHQPLYAQNVKTPRYNERDSNNDRGATYDNSVQKVRKSRSKNQIAYSQQFDQKVQEYYARMEENAKKYKKMEKDMKRPQFSDPTYFGHKHPPKKRPPGKKKYCKICGMVH